jgi:peptidoglycan hydrolase-like protein with peptidoglycan-binding domain
MLLKKGDKNDFVRQLQVKLGVEAVGTFGPKTEAAVNSFSKKHTV